MTQSERQWVLFDVKTCVCVWNAGYLTLMAGRRQIIIIILTTTTTTIIINAFLMRRIPL